jgi:ABC-type phosphate transport system ATPase subunit
MISTPVVKFEDFSLTKGFVSILRNLSFELLAGESLALVGPAGSGKSMIINLVSQLLWADLKQMTGVASVFGVSLAPEAPNEQNINFIRERIAIVTEKNPWMPLSISENFDFLQMCMGESHPIPYAEVLDLFPLHAKRKAELLAASELFPKQVEKPLLQHLAVLRALYRKPKLLLLDEALVFMDPVLLRQTESLILEASDGMSLIWATNDLHQASRVTDYTLFLLHGKPVEFNTTHEFFTSPRMRATENFIAGREEN